MAPAQAFSPPEHWDFAITFPSRPGTRSPTEHQSLGGINRVRKTVQSIAMNSIAKSAMNQRASNCYTPALIDSARQVAWGIFNCSDRR